MDDHDLLIRLDTKVDGLTGEMRTLRNDTMGRLLKVETNKVERTDFEDFKKQLAIEMAKLSADSTSGLNSVRQLVEDSKREVLETVEANRKDHEERMRAMERFMYIAIGVVTILDLIGIPLVLKYLLK